MKKCLLTGWSRSKSGSNLVTKWWHRSNSEIFLGNQWTEIQNKKEEIRWKPTKWYDGVGDGGNVEFYLRRSKAEI